MRNESLFNFLFGQRRATVPGPLNDSWYDGWLSPFQYSAGVRVDERNAMGVAAVYACVRVLSESVASLPLIIYRRLPNGGKERATDHPLYKLLSLQPNIWQTRFGFIEMMMGHTVLRGNSYAFIERKGSGVVTQLVPLHPEKMRPKQQPDGSIIYYFKTSDGTESEYAMRNVLHLQGLSTDGVCGLSPLQLLSRPIGVAISTEEYTARFFQNDATPGGVIKHPAQLGEVATNNLKKSWQEAHAGVGNSHKVAILEEGMSWQSIGISARDAQLIEARKLTTRDIARIFGVQPHKIMDLENATFSNIEEQSLEFVRDTLRPWIVRFEQTFTRALLTDREQEEYFIEFLIDGILRGDTASRFAAYQIALLNGIYSIDEVRAMENKNPLPDGTGSQHRVPLNTVSVNDEQQEEEPTEPEEDEDPEAMRDIFNALYAPILRKEVRSLQNKKILLTKTMADSARLLRSAMPPLICALFARKKRTLDATTMADLLSKIILADSDLTRSLPAAGLTSGEYEEQKRDSLWNAIVQNVKSSLQQKGT